MTVSGRVSVVDLDELEARFEALIRRVMAEDVGRAVTKEEAAERLQVSVRTVERMIARGELPALRLGKAIRIPLHRVLGLAHASEAKVVGIR